MRKKPSNKVYYDNKGDIVGLTQVTETITQIDPRRTAVQTIEATSGVASPNQVDIDDATLIELKTKGVEGYKVVDGKVEAKDKE